MKYDYKKATDEIFPLWSKWLHRDRYLINYMLDEYLYEKFGNHFKKNRPKLRSIVYKHLEEEGKIKEVCTNLFVIQN